MQPGIYMQVHLDTCTSVYVHTYMLTHLCTYVPLRLSPPHYHTLTSTPHQSHHTYIPTFTYLHVCMCAHVHVCVCVCYIIFMCNLYMYIFILLEI